MRVALKPAILFLALRVQIDNYFWSILTTWHDHLTDTILAV